MATWAMVIASPALTPCHGAADAWAAPTGEGHVEVGDREAGGLEPLVGPRVDHHRRMDVVEDALLEHDHLAAAALFGRRAEHRHRDPELVGHLRRAPVRPRRPTRR